MITEKQFSYLLFFSIISGIIAIFLLLGYSFPNERIPDKINLSEYMNLYYLNLHPRFDYLQGLWFMFIGIMMFCIIAILDLPNRFNEVKQQIIKFIYLQVIYFFGEKNYDKRKKDTKKSRNSRR